MLKLFAITALLIGGVGTSRAPAPTSSPASATHAFASTASTMPHLDPEKQAWFDEAIGHILDDKRCRQTGT